MKKTVLAMMAVMFAINFSFAQDSQAQQSSEPSPMVLPMFGNKTKTEAEQQKDEKFLSSCDKNFTNRQEASKFFMERGWEYLNEGQTDTAMYRFNLAWLLNPDNKDTYWAFGLVTAGKGQTDKAIDLYKKALKYEPNNSLLLSDLGNSYLALYNDKKKRKTLKQAKRCLSQAISADSANAFALYGLSRVKFFEKKYDEAWEYLHKGREKNLSVLDYAYLAELIAVKPDPKGFFSGNPSSSVK